MNPYREEQNQYKVVWIYSHTVRKICTCSAHRMLCWRCFGKGFIEHRVYRKEWKEEMKHE